MELTSALSVAAGGYSGLRVADGISRGDVESVLLSGTVLSKVLTSPEFVEKIPFVKTEYAGFFNGASNGIGRCYETLGNAFDLSASALEGTWGKIDEHFIETSGLDPYIREGMRGAKDALGSVGELNADLLNKMNKQFPSLTEQVSSWEKSVSVYSVDIFNNLINQGGGVIAVSYNQLAEFEQEALRFADEHGVNLTAKKIDFGIGSVYVEGVVCKIPLVGSLSDIFCKTGLDENISKKDLLEGGRDVALIITLVSMPTLAPLAGAGSITTATNIALSSAAAGGTWYGIAAGFSTLLEGGSMMDAFYAAGKAATEGAIIGAVAGAAGAAVAAKGIGLIGSLATGGSAGGGLASTYQSLKEGSTIQNALLDGAKGAAVGGVVGGVFGAGVTGVNKLLVAQRGLTGASELKLNQVSEARLGDTEFNQLIKSAQEAPYLRNKSPYLRNRLEFYAKELRDVPGLEKNLKIMSGNNAVTTKGQFAEIGRAYTLKQNGDTPIAIAKVFDVQGLGKTDIDILTTSGRWIENKHVKAIHFDSSSRLKIDKMAQALNDRVSVNVDGQLVKIRDAVFVNSGTIDAKLIDYAQTRGVKIFENTSYRRMV